MPLSTDELIEKCIDQRNRGRYEEALVSALAAAESDSENSETWWQLGLSRNALNDWKNAVAAFKKVTELNPSADNAWAYLGSAWDELGEADQAEAAYLEALDWNDTNQAALIGMAAIYAGRNDSSENEAELAILEKLETVQKELGSIEQARLANLHYNHQRYHDAIKYWKLANSKNPDCAWIYNIGLAYNNPAISQDADAVDMWRLAVDSHPDHKRSKEMIDKVLPRMIELAQSVRNGKSDLVHRDEFYDIYINPFEIMDFEDVFDLDDIDTKTIQKHKKLLIQELDLEDGIVHWLGGAHIDKSRALKICDELNDQVLKKYHFLIFTDKNLLSFLTKGDVEHFLVGQDSSLRLLKALDSDKNFREWISGYFIAQYDRVLSRALDGSNLPLIECLLDGRRWVSQAQEYDCFESSRRIIDRLLQPLRDMTAASVMEKPKMVNVCNVVVNSLLQPKLNMLPLFFESFQNEAVSMVRDIAINFVNHHNDTLNSQIVLIYCNQFKFKSQDLVQRLDTDQSQLKKLVEEESKSEVFLTVGDKTLQVTKSGVGSNGRAIGVDEVEGIRWGVTVTSNSYNQEYSFSAFVSANNVQPIIFQWSASSRSSDIAKQRSLFNSLVVALFTYIMPSLVQRNDARLREGKSLNIGPCKVTNDGVIIKLTRWFSTIEEMIPWDRCSVSIENGRMNVKDDGSHRKNISFDFNNTINAPLLIGLANKRKAN
jgi:tetratricopeptide (TPR) repeat protein